MTTLRSSLIRLAHTNPELRPHILPILAEKTAEDEMPVGMQTSGTMVRYCLALVNTLGGIITANEEEDFLQVPGLLSNLITQVKLIQREVGDDPYRAMNLAEVLSKTLTKKLKILL